MRNLIPYRWILLSLFCCFATGLFSQFQKEYASSAVSGMIRHTAQKSKNSSGYTYSYTLTPEGANCIFLDYQLAASGQQPVQIEVFAGGDKSGSPLISLGKKDTLVQFVEDSLTLVFKESRENAASQWSVVWKSSATGNCSQMRPRPQDCQYAQPICGPFYQENNLYYGSGKTADLKDYQSSQGLEEHHSMWYQFETSDSGWLHFALVPDGPHTDFDWTLWRAEEGEICDLITQQSLQALASNYSAAGGMFGSTGMDETGLSFHETATGRPFSRAIRVQPDEAFYLLVDAREPLAGRFHIRFSDNVYTCIQPDRQLLNAQRRERAESPLDATRHKFMQRTQLIRVPFTPIANRELQRCKFSRASLAALPGADKILNSGVESMIRGEHKLPDILLMGMQLGVIQGYSCEDLKSPVHYGDIMHAAWDLVELPDSMKNRVKDYWKPGRMVMGNYSNAVELVELEYFETVGSISHSEVQWIRLIWTDFEGKQPDRNIAMFKFKELLPLLERVAVWNPRSGPEVSVAEFLRQKSYQGVRLSKNGKSDGMWEYKNFLWPEED